MNTKLQEVHGKDHYKWNLLQVRTCYTIISLHLMGASNDLATVTMTSVPNTYAMINIIASLLISLL